MRAIGGFRQTLSERLVLQGLESLPLQARSRNDANLRRVHRGFLACCMTSKPVDRTASRVRTSVESNQAHTQRQVRLRLQ